MAKFIKRPKLPGLQVPGKLDSEMRAFLEALKERVEASAGDRGDPKMRALTLADLEAAGLGKAIIKNGFAEFRSNLSSSDAATSASSSTSSSSTLDVDGMNEVDPESLDEQYHLIIWDTQRQQYWKLPFAQLADLFVSRQDDDELLATLTIVAPADDEDAGPTRLRFEDEDGITDEKLWDILTDAGLLEVRAIDDAEAAPVVALRISRTGTTIDAIDLRCTEIWQNGAPLNLGGGLGAAASTWRFDTTTTAADPTTGRFRFNNASPLSVTAIYLDDLTNEGIDASTVLGLLAVGNRIYVQDKDDATVAALYEISGALTDNTGWWTVPVTAVSASASAPANNAVCLVALMFSATAGSPGPTGPTGPTGPADPAANETITGQWTFAATANPYDVIFNGYPQFNNGFECRGYIEFNEPAGGSDFLTWYWINNDGALNEKVWIMESDASLKTWSFRHCTDAYGSYKDVLVFHRNGNAVDSITYGNSADDPQHIFNGTASIREAGTEKIGLSLDDTGAVGVLLTHRSNVYAEYQLQSYVDDTFGPTFTFYKARGTIAAPAQNLSGDQLGGFYWGSRGNASNWVFPAAVDFMPDSNTTTTVSGWLRFQTGTSFGALTERMSIHTDGRVRLGVDGSLEFDEHTSAPSTPAAGKVALYAKADGLLYSKDDAGTETLVSGGAGGGGGGGGGGGVVTIDPAVHNDFFEDFCTSVSNETGWEWLATGAGTGSGVTRIADEASRFGIVRLSTGTTAGGNGTLTRAAAIATASPRYYLEGTNDLVFEALVRVDAAPDATNAYQARLGWRDNSVNANIAWLYANYTGGSAVWSAITGAAGVLTTTDTSTAVAANTWYHIKIRATTGSVRFYVNGVLVATHTTNIPTAGMTEYFAIVKSAGTTARLFDVDMVWTWKDYAAVRSAYLTRPAAKFGYPPQLGYAGI